MYINPTTNAGTTGQLNTIPLTGLTVGSSGWIARERSDNVRRSDRRRRPVARPAAAASKLTASGGCALNERLMMAKANLIWQPVAFVDFGMEYTYGQRKVVSGSQGNEHVITSRFRLRF